ncbi:MAG: 2-succinyl-5-enolpyruvyl-6-hydroxy-3-cyclohexene-1-carboxylic-acid synthase [Cyclobacteriaceae bacterium]
MNTIIKKEKEIPGTKPHHMVFLSSFRQILENSMIIQSLVDIVSICAKKGINRVVISPGSRSAFLTIAFARHADIQKFVVPDERSAAYIALGMAAERGTPVALLCTSGTAAVNYYPAITEAWYQQVPLVVFTADRPPEWVEQLDGQTIQQTNIFNNHIKSSFNFPVEATHPDALWHTHRMINEAINLSMRDVKGPVHINVPIREPFYPESGESFAYDSSIKIIEEFASSSVIAPQLWQHLEPELLQSKKVLLVGGQGQASGVMTTLVKKLANTQIFPILGDVISNLHDADLAIKNHDTFLPLVGQDYQPDLLITWGQSVISKNLKSFLRKYKPKQHWHIQLHGEVADTYQSLTKILRLSPEVFMERLLALKESLKEESLRKYWALWNKSQIISSQAMDALVAKIEFGEMLATDFILKNLPAGTDLHLANSMPVRYANICGLKASTEDIRVFANRGTSGIDGCTGTALGSALSSRRNTLLITGDIAFFYDRNSLWHPHLPANLKIVIMNNRGGGIFRLINGPASLPELTQSFETKHENTAELSAKDLGIDYHSCDSLDSLQSQWPLFIADSNKAAILEIHSKGAINDLVFQQYKKEIADCFVVND